MLMKSVPGKDYMMCGKGGREQFMLMEIILINDSVTRGEGRFMLTKNILSKDYITWADGRLMKSILVEDSITG